MADDRAQKHLSSHPTLGQQEPHLHFFMTGVSSGIGAYVLLKALSEGGSVTAIVRTDAQKRRLLLAHPQRLTLHVADLSDRARIGDIAAVLQTQAFSHILLNAGSATLGKLAAVSPHAIAEMFEANLISHVILLNRLLPQALSNDSKIALVSSLTAKMPGTHYACYGISKAGLSYAAKALRIEYPMLRILCVELGGVDSPFHDKARSAFSTRARFKKVPEVGNRLYQALLRRNGNTTLYWDFALLSAIFTHFSAVLIWCYGLWARRMSVTDRRVASP
jgi:NAD(P)-dependent dehydrogenase (short-subunit alcohol dehydrogenase family)